jgi:hypothetical protein
MPTFCIYCTQTPVSVKGKVCAKCQVLHNCDPFDGDPILTARCREQDRLACQRKRDRNKVKFNGETATPSQRTCKAKWYVREKLNQQERTAQLRKALSSTKKQQGHDLGDGEIDSIKESLGMNLARCHGMEKMHRESAFLLSNDPNHPEALALQTRLKRQDAARAALRASPEGLGNVFSLSS